MSKRKLWILSILQTDWDVHELTPLTITDDKTTALLWQKLTSKHHGGSLELEYQSIEIELNSQVDPKSLTFLGPEHEEKLLSMLDIINKRLSGGRAKKWILVDSRRKKKN
jgi:hypothetical protein